MPVHNAEVAAIFDEIADLLELEGANPFRVRAYRNAARVVRDLGRDVAAMAAAGEDLTELPGVGADLAGKIREITTTGRCASLDELRLRTPPVLAKLLTIPGLGPKRIQALHRSLHIRTIDQLARAARAGRIHELPGFGEKTERRILQAIATRAGDAGRVPLALALQYAEPLADHLRRAPGVERVVVAGSDRRGKETVGDLDILATASPREPVLERLVGCDEVASVLSRGSTRATVVLRSGLQVDLRVVAAESYGAALHYFTGSKALNIAIRQLGQQAGLKINEYGVFRGDRRIAGRTEESVYASVGLPYIPPELRADRGEIEAARDRRLPKLVDLDDLRGDLHSHTDATDGRNNLREMARAARERGFEYLAITDHSRRVTVARGLDERRLLAQVEEIDRLNEELEGLTLLKGIEVDIREDGALDLPDEVLGRLEIVVASIHSRFNLSRERQTTRILRAMDHPHFHILAHPTGRLLLRREPYDLDLERILRHARQRGCSLELNAHPERLDLTDLACRMARDPGVLISIDSDAHTIHDFNNLRFGVGQARRGWLAKEDILNARPLAALRALLAGTTAAGPAAAGRGNGQRRLIDAPR
jgi:DNA polymerase (family 10)